MARSLQHSLRARRDRAREGLMITAGRDDMARGPASSERFVAETRAQRRIARMLRISWLASRAVIVLGCAVLFGWLFDLQVLQSLHPCSEHPCP